VFPSLSVDNNFSFVLIYNYNELKQAAILHQESSDDTQPTTETMHIFTSEQTRHKMQMRVEDFMRFMYIQVLLK